MSSLPTEIQSRVRCLDWSSDHRDDGGPGPMPPRAKCAIDPRYLVGGKRTMLAAFLSLRSIPKMSSLNVLVLGLGGGVIPMQLLSLFPNLTVTVVELEAAVVQLANRCFGVPVSDANLRVVVEDAVSFIQKQIQVAAPAPAQLFDLIINDISNDLINLDSIGGTANDSLHSISIFTSIVKLLKPEGLFIMNQIEVLGPADDAVGESRKMKKRGLRTSGDNDSSTSNEQGVLEAIQQNMRDGGFLTTRALLNEKVGRAIMVGSLKANDSFDHVRVLRSNANELGLSTEKGEHWRDVDSLEKELRAFV